MTKINKEEVRKRASEKLEKAKNGELKYETLSEVLEREMPRIRREAKAEARRITASRRKCKCKKEPWIKITFGRW
jgi:hypothetical protein